MGKVTGRPRSSVRIVVGLHLHKSRLRALQADIKETNMQSITDHKVWFITGWLRFAPAKSSAIHIFIWIPGCSSGLGLEIVREALRRNDKVIATARSLDSISHLESESCKIMQFDVTEDPSILQRKAAAALQFWNRVDILVNNAGSGMVGFQEEIP